jgi:hypothetical protein
MISGRMIPGEEEDKGKQASAQPAKLRPGTYFSLEEPLHPSFNEVFVSDGYLDTPERHAEAWKPLVSILGHFRHLSHLVYECRGRFAPGLVAAIQRHHPACKIHLRRFRFTSLNDDITDPDELALAASPCLHSLSILGTWRDSNGIDDHNTAAALSTISLAPNLKHVRMLGCRPASSPSLYRSRDRPVEAWKGFNLPSELFGKASLESLSFCTYYDKLSEKKLVEWIQIADFTMLRGFSFAVTDAGVLPQLMAYTGFGFLEELSILLQRKESDEEFKSVVEAFFLDLNPLAVLDLSGTVHEQLLHVICQRHGSRLQKLVLRPYEDHYGMAGPPLQLQSTHIRVIAHSCPRLSDLNIRIKRTRGDAVETACYEALATIETLKVAQIHLDCSNPSDSRSEGSQLEIALVNSAIDETLAKSIWDIICGGSNQQQLESLTISSGGGSAFGNSHPGDLMTLVNHLSRSYLILKPGISNQDAVTVVELTKEWREQSDERQRGHEQTMLEKWGHKGLNGSAYRAFNQLWPYEESGKDWREVWQSWSLQRGI